jgi:hypothetical protein
MTQSQPERANRNRQAERYSLSGGRGPLRLEPDLDQPADGFPAQHAARDGAIARTITSGNGRR